MVGCGSDTNDTGSLFLSLSDGPLDGATQVVVKFDAIELKLREGDNINIVFEQLRSIDLLALQNGVSTP